MAAGVMAAAVVLAGCGSGSGSGGSGSGLGDGSAGPGRGAAGSTTAAPRRSSVPPAVPSPAPPKATARAGTDAGLRSCYDGSCEITVTGPVTIPVADRFGFPAVEVTRVGADGVTIEANGGGTHLESGVSPGGTAALNGISVRVRAVRGSTAELSISHD